MSGQNDYGQQQQQQQYQQQYQQYQQAGQYQQPTQQYYQNAAPQQYPQSQSYNEPVSFGEWMITMLLMCIPIVDLVMLFVWAFGSNAAPSKQNWAKASLVWILIGIGLSILFSVILVAAGISLASMR